MKMYMSKGDFITKGYIMLNKYYVIKDGLETKTTAQISDFLEQLITLDNFKFNLTIAILMKISNVNSADELLNLLEKEIENSFE